MPARKTDGVAVAAKHLPPLGPLCTAGVASPAFGQLQALVRPLYEQKRAFDLLLARSVAGWVPWAQVQRLRRRPPLDAATVRCRRSCFPLARSVDLVALPL